MDVRLPGTDIFTTSEQFLKASLPMEVISLPVSFLKSARDFLLP